MNIVAERREVVGDDSMLPSLVVDPSVNMETPKALDPRRVEEPQVAFTLDAQYQPEALAQSEVARVRFGMD